MAKLTKKAVEEFQEITLRKHGLMLSYEQAETLARDWLEFFKLTCEPTPEEINERRQK
jgi:hypothetical protein